MEYMSAREAADKWGISQRRVAILCAEHRISEATMVGNMWIIPTTAEKPIDARSTRYTQSDSKKVKPFLKWAGGKGQLLSEIEKYYPFEDGTITKYAEPFVGGGAVLFDILSKYDLEEVYISDINAELINTYRIIRDDIDELVNALMAMQSEFVPMNTEHRKVYYMAKRERFNDLKVNGNESVNIEKAALMIFLNKTCFNGLFRVNKKGLFNVPMGSYKKPMICDEENLRAVSEKLQNVKIVCGDYRESADFIDENTFVYFDPPYRPITDTASFTAYTENLFNDEDQIELARFVDDMHRTGAKVVISDNQRLMSERTKYSVIVKEVFYDENVIEAVSNEEAMSLAIHEYEMQSHNKCRKASEISISIRSNFSHIIAEKTADTNEWEIL